MGVATRAKKRRLEEEEVHLEDRISCLPDDVLGDIIALLSTKDGARTQVLSSRWRHIWRSAPLIMDLHEPGRRILASEISGILSSHSGPGRRFSIPAHYLHYHDSPTRTLDGWLRSPALDNFQELELHFHDSFWGTPLTPTPLPTSVLRFSSTLHVASFIGACCFPDGNNAGALHLPLLKQLTLVNVRIAESSLHALLAGCPALVSLLLLDNNGCPRVQIVSPSLRSIGVRSGWKDLRLRQLVIKDAPCLERLLFSRGMEMDILVISAPRLDVLGQLSGNFPRLQFGTTVFQGSTKVSMTMVVCSVKVLALSDVKNSLDAVINLMKCFPHLEKLYIETALVGQKKAWYKYRKLISTLDIRLREIVLANYRGNKSHINFAKFFISNAKVLESMRFELEVASVSNAWIQRQHRLLQIEKRAPRGARFDFVPSNRTTGSLDLVRAKQVHDLSTDPFQKFHYLVC